ncbi:MAG: class I SAM-dependent methyltransferase [Gammaproteobacteria bacterium]
MLRGIAYRVRYALSILDFGALALRPFDCALCGRSLLLRLSHDSIGVRCLRCAASAIALSMVSTLVVERPGFRGERVYELSSRGPLFGYLRREVKDLTFSEYFDDVAPGAFRDGVQCQDIQQLTYPDAYFDLVTSTEVFEHVADDRKGFAEIRRVLRPGGAFLFTVPIKDAKRTVERALLRDGKLEHLLPPAFHDDRIRGRGQVLVFRDYGRDIAGRLLEAGFGSAHIETRFERAFLGAGCGVVVART